MLTKYILGTDALVAVPAGPAQHVLGGFDGVGLYDVPQPLDDRARVQTAPQPQLDAFGLPPQPVQEALPVSEQEILTAFGLPPQPAPRTTAQPAMPVPVGKPIAAPVGQPIGPVITDADKAMADAIKKALATTAPVTSPVPVPVAAVKAPVPQAAPAQPPAPEEKGALAWLTKDWKGIPHWLLATGGLAAAWWGYRKYLLAPQTTALATVGDIEPERFFSVSRAADRANKLLRRAAPMSGSSLNEMQISALQAAKIYADNNLIVVDR
jgi:hypothetical protein